VDTLLTDELWNFYCVVIRPERKPLAYNTSG
jgi:hypothetical protein